MSSTTYVDGVIYTVSQRKMPDCEKHGTKVVEVIIDGVRIKFCRECYKERKTKEC